MDFEQKISLTRAKAAAIRQTLNTPGGRILMGHLRREYKDDPMVDSNDTNYIMRHVGQRDVVLDLEHIIMNTDEDYIE